MIDEGLELGRPAGVTLSGVTLSGVTLSGVTLSEGGRPAIRPSSSSLNDDDLQHKRLELPCERLTDPVTPRASPALPSAGS